LKSFGVLRYLIGSQTINHRFTKGFQVNNIVRRWLNNFKARITRRLDKSKDTMTFEPEFKASNIHYEVSAKTGAILCGGIGAMHLLAKRLGLPEAIDQRLQLLKIHLPYQDSDHVLNIAYNPLCGGTCLQDLELRRNDENYLNALGTRRIPDPTTAGDYCRRFTAADCFTYIDMVNDIRRKVWAKQPKEFFKRATINMDGSLTETLGECKQGMDIAYDGTWGYHPLLLTLAETREVLSIVNRSGNRPSHEGAAAEVDRAIALCDQAGFEMIVLHGDTDFSQTRHLDRWDSNPKVRFVFGFDRNAKLEEMAANLPESDWQVLERPARYTVKTEQRQRPANVKEQIVKQRQFENKRLQSEHVAEFLYEPTACGDPYRMVALRKNISVEKGDQVLFPLIVYFFYYVAWTVMCRGLERVLTRSDRDWIRGNISGRSYRDCRNPISPLSFLHGMPPFFPSTSQLFNALAFISKSTSAYTFVVISDTCPSHARIVLMSTPERSRWVAVVCRIVCGPIRLVAKDGTSLTARATQRSTSAWMPNRVIGRPLRLRNTCSVAPRPCTMAASSLTVCAHSGHRRDLFPFPRSRTEARSRSGTCGNVKSLIRTCAVSSARVPALYKNRSKA
jgi:hypothetical protein